MTSADAAAQTVLFSRSKHLKARTSDTHERLDHTIMAADPFASRQRYGLFVTVQYQFHRDIDALYDSPVLDGLLPDLQGRRRFLAVARDLEDLEIASPVANDEAAFAIGQSVDIPTALGWLYVAEGSNLGAAFLLKQAAKLGLSEEFGARHLAGAPEGRGLHWRTFTSALDEIELSGDEQERVVAGAQSAFRRVHALVAHVFG